MKVRKKRHYNSLNYLRALAFIAVSLFHRIGFIVKGGYLGVLIFLVLSGFLSTKTDYNKIYSLDNAIKKLINKLINLIGPVLFVLASSLSYALIFAREIFDDSIKSALAVGLNFENIRRIVIKEDYFNQLGNFNITTHLWYISLFIQIMLIYMIVTYLIKNKSEVFKISTWSAIAILSFLSMLIKAKTSDDITRVYYGPDTRISAFAIGASLFYLSRYLPWNKLNKKSLQIAIGLLSLGVVVPFFLIDGRKISSYRDFFIFYTILVGLLVLSLYQYENTYVPNKKKLSGVEKVFSYVGDRSYYLYLWQYVVQIFMVYYKVNTINKFLAIVIEILALFILSEITYLLFKNLNIKLSLIVVSAILIVGLRIVSLFIGNQKSEDIDNLRSEISQNQEDLKRRNIEAMNKAKNENILNQKKDDPIANANDANEIEKETSNKNTIPPTKKLNDNFKKKAYDDFDFTENELAYLSNLKIVAVGDSVIINADSYIRKFVPNFYLDGEVGRDMPDGPTVLAGLIGSVGEGDIYLVSLGSNGSANTSDMDAIMSQTGDKDVYFINTSHTQPYMDYVNSSIEEYTKTHDRAHLIDWRNFIKDKPDLLAPDRTHPNKEGSDDFAKLIMRAILNVN